MRTILWILLGCLCLGAHAAEKVGASPAEAPRIKTGVWELRTRAVTLENGRETPTMIREKRMDSDALVPRALHYGKSCRRHSLRQSPSTLEWEIRCSEGDLYSVHGSFRIHPDRYEGTVTHRRRSLYGRIITVENRISARFLRPDVNTTDPQP